MMTGDFDIAGMYRLPVIGDPARSPARNPSVGW